MILKSIKWRLQLWYGLILVAVLVGFGVTAYQLERNRQLRRVDDEVHRRIGAIAQTLHRPPRGGPLGRPPGDFPPPPDFPDGNLPGPERPPPRFSVTPQLAALFETNSTDQFYYIILGRNGNVIGQSDYQPPSAMEKHRSAWEPEDRPAPGGQRGLLQFGSWREFAERLPSGELIRVGASMVQQQHDLKVEAFMLAGVGAAILLVGFTGGWIFVGRALRPISAISATAAKISAGDLSQRINTAGAASELGELSSILNSTFARLEAAFAQQKQFASDAAHELRTPVSVILTQTQLALSRDRDTAGYKQTVEACQRAAQRMRKLIETLLELARFDAGQEVLKHLKFDLSKVVSESVEMVQTLADERRVKIHSELQPFEITGDPERIAQVATNLLMNAVQYNQPDGEVSINLEATNGLAVLEFADTGKGIAKEDLPRVFERFYRSDKSRTGAGNSGLGLSICKSIVEAHGGTIEVSSTPMVGSRFVVRLPVAS